MAELVPSWETTRMAMAIPYHFHYHLLTSFEPEINLKILVNFHHSLPGTQNQNVNQALSANSVNLVMEPSLASPQDLTTGSGGSSDSYQ